MKTTKLNYKKIFNIDGSTEEVTLDMELDGDDNIESALDHVRMQMILHKSALVADDAAFKEYIECLHLLTIPDKVSKEGLERANRVVKTFTEKYGRK